MLALTLRGIEWSMLMCAVFVVVASPLGLLVGALAGYFGGMVDDLLMRSVDITLTVPFFVVVLVLTAAFPSARSPIGLALLIALSSWMALARIVRAQFLSLRQREYVEAAQALGASDRRIMLRHLLPNSLGDITVWLTLGATAAIGTEATLSFIGYGVQGSEVSLGRLRGRGRGGGGQPTLAVLLPRGHAAAHRAVGEHGRGRHPGRIRPVPDPPALTRHAGGSPTDPADPATPAALRIEP